MFILVFCIFIFLGYLDHSKYDVVYNPLAYPSLQLEKNKNEQMQIFSAPCSDFGGG
jgi:hypothetical protein